MTQLTRFLCVLFVALAAGVAASEPSTPVDKATGTSLLRALRYADTQRSAIASQCRRKPELKLKLPACLKADSVPSEIIENIALPYVSKYISVAQASEAITFWDSPPGRELVGVMLVEIRTDNPHLLSEEQLALLAQFNRTEANQALKRFGADSALATEVIRAIGSYAP